MAPNSFHVPPSRKFKRAFIPAALSAAGGLSINKIQTLDGPEEGPIEKVNLNSDPATTLQLSNHEPDLASKLSPISWRTNDPALIYFVLLVVFVYVYNREVPRGKALPFSSIEDDAKRSFSASLNDFQCQPNSGSVMDFRLKAVLGGHTDYIPKGVSEAKFKPLFTPGGEYTVPLESKRGNGEFFGSPRAHDLIAHKSEGESLMYCYHNITDKRRMLRSLTKDNLFGNEGVLKRVLNEVRIHEMLDHPNIIKMYEIFEDTQNVYMMMEGVGLNQMSLSKFLEERSQFGSKVSFPEATDCFIADQILSVLKYMREKQITRDITADDIIITWDGSAFRDQLEQQLIDMKSGRTDNFTIKFINWDKNAQLSPEPIKLDRYPTCNELLEKLGYGSSFESFNKSMMDGKRLENQESLKEAAVDDNCTDAFRACVILSEKVREMQGVFESLGGSPAKTLSEKLVRSGLESASAFWNSKMGVETLKDKMFIRDMSAQHVFKILDVDNKGILEIDKLVELTFKTQAFNGLYNGYGQAKKRDNDMIYYARCQYDVMVKEGSETMRKDLELWSANGKSINYSEFIGMLYMPIFGTALLKARKYYDSSSDMDRYTRDEEIQKKYNEAVRASIVIYEGNTQPPTFSGSIADAKLEHFLDANTGSLITDEGEILNRAKEHNVNVLKHSKSQRGDEVVTAIAANSAPIFGNMQKRNNVF